MSAETADLRTISRCSSVVTRHEFVVENVTHTSEQCPAKSPEHTFGNNFGTITVRACLDGCENLMVNLDIKVRPTTAVLSYLLRKVDLYNLSGKLFKEGSFYAVNFDVGNRASLSRIQISSCTRVD